MHDILFKGKHGGLGERSVSKVFSLQKLLEAYPDIGFFTDISVLADEHFLGVTLHSFSFLSSVPVHKLLLGIPVCQVCCLTQWQEHLKAERLPHQQQHLRKNCTSPTGSLYESVTLNIKLRAERNPRRRHSFLLFQRIYLAPLLFSIRWYF